MMRLLSQMLKLPVAAFVYSLEMIVSTLRGIQKMADQSIDTMIGSDALTHGDTLDRDRPLTNDPGGSIASGAVSDGDQAINQTTDKEEKTMPDQDLSGEDLKYVSYSILFTKPDLEATLEEQKEQLVNYATDGASYAGLKIAHFMGHVAANKVKRPQVWAENNYPSGAKGDYDWVIPEEDEKYITFIFQVDRRLAKHDANYPKEQVKVLKQIRDRLDKI